MVIGTDCTGTKFICYDVRGAKHKTCSDEILQYRRVQPHDGRSEVMPGSRRAQCPEGISEGMSGYRRAQPPEGSSEGMPGYRRVKPPPPIKGEPLIMWNELKHNFSL